MPRNVYGPDHEAFRETAREFVERSLKPRAEDFLKDKAIGREVWLEAGEQGLLGLEVPEQYGGSEAGDFRFNAVLAEELSKFTAAASSCFGIHTDCVAPYLVDLGTEEQKQRWLPGFCSGELVTAIAMTEPSGGSDLAALKTTAVARRRRLDPQRLQDLHHQRLLGRPRGRRRPHRPRARAPRASRCSASRPAWRASSRGRKLDKVGQEESDTAELFFDDVRGPGRQPHRRGRPRLHRHDGAAAAGAHRRRGVQHRPRAADPASRPSTTPRSARRSASRSAPSSTTSSCIAELLTKIEVTQAYVDDCVVAHAERRADRGRRREGQVVVARRCRTTCWTRASSCTAATAT